MPATILIVDDDDKVLAAKDAAATALSDDRSMSGLPVVFVTSHTKYEDRAKELGAVAYLTKPVSTKQLFATLAQHVGAA